MTGLALLFEHSGINTPIRVVERDEQKWMPLNDVADGIGHDRSGLHHLFNRNAEILGKYSGMVKIATPGGHQDFLCLNRDGVIGILMKVDFVRIKDESRKKRVIAFQDWAIAVLSEKLQETKPVPAVVPVQNPAEQKTPSQIAYEASKFAKMTGADPRAVAAAMLERSGYGFLVSLLPSSEKIPVVPAPSPKPPGYYTATEIGQVIGKKAHEVNMWLYQMRPAMIIRDGENIGEWRITDAGLVYGDEFPYSPVPDKKFYRVYWRKEILEKFNVRPDTILGRVPV